MIHVFRSKISLSHSPEKIHSGTTFVMCSRKNRVAKKLKEKGGSIKIFCRIFCLTVPKVFVGNPLVFHCFWVSTTFTLRRAKSLFSVENFLSHSAEKFVGDPFSF